MKRQDFLLKQNNFCVLLTAAIDANGCVSTVRVNPQVREQDYIGSLKLWLSKTDLPIVFCENSGYNLKNIRLLADEYPGRVEIIQFDGNNFPRHMGKSYGEFKTIEKALEESYFISQSDNIIKVTGRIYIDNINRILASFKNDTFVQYDRRHHTFHSIKTLSVVFIFKKPFFTYLKNLSHEIVESNGGFFEKAFESAIEMARQDKYKCRRLKAPHYIGYCGTVGVEYQEFFLTFENFFPKLIITIKSAPFRIHRSILGKSGIFIKKYFPEFYKLLKPYFPDKK